MTWTWERTVEEDTGGEDWCGRRGCRTKTGSRGGTRAVFEYS